MSKINFKQALQEIDGTEIETGEGKKFTLGEAVAKVLTNDKQSKDPKRSYRLGMDIYNNAELNLTNEDIDFILESLERSGHAVIIRGQLESLLSDAKSK